MNGAAALAEALHSCTDYQYTVPGFPITEVGTLTGATLAVNEKTALEYALGDSLAGKRAAAIIKNVGVNACADPLVNATAQGLIGGVLLVVGDDPEAVGSQTAQDSRYYGELAEIPVLEPDESTLFAAVELALEASEESSRVAMLRVTPRLLDAEMEWRPVKRQDRKGHLSPRDLTMNGRVTASQELYRTLFAWSESSLLNTWNAEPLGAGPAPGKSRVVTVHPVPGRVSGYLRINECGRSFVRDHRGVMPPEIGGAPKTLKKRGFYRTFCRECPYKLLLDLMKSRDMRPICDAGCSLYAMNPQYSMGLASYGMGSSIAVAARSTHVALLGDYALLHSGINALIDVYEKRFPLLCVVMRNHCAAMTGGQPASDPLPYITWADPVVCGAEDEHLLGNVIRQTDTPVTVVVEAQCPEGVHHETVEC
ncbi:MAG: thiamine pyrophosphate-dependent enzyme [Methanoregula sp.]|jgi:TPP-dependent indolepyruvate ferredoxin oxidoreductase alpha subunit